MEARLLADHCDYRASSRGIEDEVRDIVGMMGTCDVAQECFGEAGAAEKELVVEGWLGLEDDLHAIEDTVDVECAMGRATADIMMITLFYFRSCVYPAQLLPAQCERMSSHLGASWVGRGGQ